MTVPRHPQADSESSEAWSPRLASSLRLGLLPGLFMGTTAGFPESGRVHRTNKGRVGLTRLAQVQTPAVQRDRSPPACSRPSGPLSQALPPAPHSPLSSLSRPRKKGQAPQRPGSQALVLGPWPRSC